MEHPFLAGRLELFRVPQLLRLLQFGHLTGCLELERGSTRARLFVEEGRTLFVRADLSAPRLGDLLVAWGELRPEALEFALAIQNDDRRTRLGRMLVESGALTEAQLDQAVTAVQKHLLLETFTWNDGTFRFLHGERVLDEDVRLELNVDALLVAALAYLPRTNPAAVGERAA